MCTSEIIKISNAKIGGGNQSENLNRMHSSWTVIGLLGFEIRALSQFRDSKLSVGRSAMRSNLPTGKTKFLSFKGKRGTKGENNE